MKTPTLQILSGLIVATAIFTACENSLENKTSQINLPKAAYTYNIGVNDQLPTLGRVLFYDTRLSANNATSCASCHKQEFAFSDNKNFSKGFRGESTVRNSMPIQNLISTEFPATFDPASGIPFKSTSLFWDGRQEDILAMVMEPIQNHIEMGVNSLDDLEAKVKSIQDYEGLFQDAFGSKQIMKNRIASALSAFIVSIRSTGSRFDRALKGTADMLSQQEQHGMELFFSTYNCNSCHQLQFASNGYQVAATASFTEQGGFADIGLDVNPPDGGVFRQTGIATDVGKFKIPSLRNVALTAPYMHDGRFNTLEEVVDHYSTGIENSANLDERLRNDNGTPKQFNIPVNDKQAIVAFLKSMTDNLLINDPRYSNPFVVR